MRFAVLVLASLLGAVSAAAQVNQPTLQFGDFSTDAYYSVEVRYSQPVLVLVARGGNIHIQFGAGPHAPPGMRVRLRMIESASLVDQPCLAGCALYLQNQHDFAHRIVDVDTVGFHVRPSGGWPIFENDSGGILYYNPYYCTEYDPVLGCAPFWWTGQPRCQCGPIGVAMVCTIELY
ncbi:MAG: hypothetical protein IPM29_20425 [Planctomycetes bacterium]|nr:hypothetical protein [Planctomycetota bacterium]